MSFLGGDYGNDPCAKGQEESLCRSTTLYPRLLLEKDFYVNKGEKSSDKVIITRDVKVFRKDSNALLLEKEQFCVDVISCAAPNQNNSLRINDSFAEEVLNKALNNRINNILHVAASKGIKCLVLGAWGCGTFRNDPEQVSGIFRELIHGTYASVFETIVFALGPTTFKGIGHFYRIAAGKSRPPMTLHHDVISTLKYNNASAGDIATLTNKHGLIRKGDLNWKSMEHYYQQAKFRYTDQDDYRQLISSEDPIQFYSKQVSQDVKSEYCYSPEEWKHMSVDVMYTGLLIKFTMPEYRKTLINTGTATLTFDVAGDAYWGGTENMHGKVLMNVRSRLIPKILYRTASDTYFQDHNDDIVAWRTFIDTATEGNDNWMIDNREDQQAIDWYAISTDEDNAFILNRTKLSIDDSSAPIQGMVADERWPSAEHYYLAATLLDSDSNYKCLKPAVFGILSEIDSEQYYTRCKKGAETATQIKQTLKNKGIVPTRDFDKANIPDTSRKIMSMWRALNYKFGLYDTSLGTPANETRIEDLRKLLLATSNKILIHVDPDDLIWGATLQNTSSGPGFNYVGRMLMLIRGNLIEKENERSPSPVIRTPRRNTPKQSVAETTKAAAKQPSRAPPKANLPHIAKSKTEWDEGETPPNKTYKVKAPRAHSVWDSFLSRPDVIQAMDKISYPHITNCLNNTSTAMRVGIEISHVDWTSIRSVKGVVKFYDKGKDTYYMTNLHQIDIKDEDDFTWKSSEQYFQAYKYRRGNDIINPDPYYRIVKCYESDTSDRSPFNTQKGLQSEGYSPRKDFYDGDNFNTMWDVLKLKFGVHIGVEDYSDGIKKLRASLADTKGYSVLIEDSGSNDYFWGNGTHTMPGCNYLGRMLMLIRALAQNEMRV